MCPQDADAYLAFDKKVRVIASFLAYINVATPPDAKSPSLSDAIMGLKLGKAFKDIGAVAGRETIRSLPMAVADLVQETFHDEALRGPLSTRGIKFTATGPWAAGTASVFLNDSAGNDGGAPGEATFAKGGTGALAAALAKAAGSLGVTIRTGAEVVRIRTTNGRVVGVTLADGTEIDTKAVVTAADPKRTLNLCDPVELGPHMVWRANNIRTPGATAKVNLALSGLPNFTALKNGRAAALQGRIHIGSEIDYLERAFDESKYGNFSRRPYLEATIPSLTDPTLAPEGKHVMSIYMQYAPYKLKGDWESQRRALGQTVVQTLAEYAPNLPEMILTHQIITPHDLEEVYGMTGGQIFHGELALDQFFTMRPLLDWARYRTPIENLYLCGSGTHPGAGLTGGSGANAAREILKELKK
jgi:phytoene dehydrogenase-like protein